MKYCRFHALLLPLCLSLIASCTVFAPPYKAEADVQVSKAYEQITEITACIDLGLCATTKSFKGKEENYTKAISALKSAYLIVASWKSNNPDLPATEANTTLLEIVKGCESAIVTLADLHKSVGLIAGSGVSQPVDIQCDQAVRAIRANK